MKTNKHKDIVLAENSRKNKLSLKKKPEQLTPTDHFTPINQHRSITLIHQFWDSEPLSEPPYNHQHSRPGMGKKHEISMSHITNEHGANKCK
jgi:hypothetical protein